MRAGIVTMNATDTIYSVDVLKTFSDAALYKCLFECWGITNGKLEVWGELIIEHTGYSQVINIKTLSENREITYPADRVKRPIESGVWISRGLAQRLNSGDTKVWIKCELELASEEEREKQKNPLTNQCRGKI